MTLQVRAIRPEESDVLSYWQRADNVVCYRRARIVRLAEKGWKAEEVAEALGLHVDIVRQTIKDFNKAYYHDVKSF